MRLSLGPSIRDLSTAPSPYDAMRRLADSRKHWPAPTLYRMPSVRGTWQRWALGDSYWHTDGCESPHSDGADKVCQHGHPTVFRRYFSE